MIVLEDILLLADKLPSGAYDEAALSKLIAECDEFDTAMADDDIVGAYTELADVVYYSAKLINTLAEQAGVTMYDALRFAAAKYALRAEPGNPKNDEAERAAVLASLCE